MKKIIKSNKDTIFVDNLPLHPIIGAKDKSSKEKHFVVMTKYSDKTSYKVLCRSGFERGNCYDAPTLSGSLDNVMNHPNLEFFLFDSSIELFAWLAMD